MAKHLKREDLTSLVRKHKFSDLFIELGWDKENLDSKPLHLPLKDGRVFQIDRVVEKRGFVICVCDAGKKYPTSLGDRRQLINGLSLHHYEHLLIIHGNGRQCWTVAIRPQNRPMRTAEVEWSETQDIQPLMEKLDGMIFDISEEDGLGITDVVEQVRGAFMKDAEKVTRKFYSLFKKELSSFSDFIKGIEEQVSKEWYAALMLNRLMFIYFIQKKHFLDGDIDYLEKRLKLTKEEYGKDKFHDRFYRRFLRRLFSEGLGMPESERGPELKSLLGKIPYLNGGLFDLHQIEQDNKNIQIPDKAFERLFEFFSRYDWHLDSSPTATGKDINPDVIGYIFEKYINDRASMGAYYTQEDITGYIARNTIIPFLLHRTKEKCNDAFDSQNGIWKYLKEEPDKYIHEAVKKGCDVPDSDVPENIRKGMDTKAPKLIERRKDWNTKADERFALPTETWRETMARRKRYFELKEKMKSGGIHEIDDLITYNLDIERFASDALRHYKGSDFVAAFYESIAGKRSLRSDIQEKRGITVLDPACGSGAFLFAALNILEPLYEDCVEKMKIFVSEDESLRGQGARKGTKKHQQFRAVLEEIETHQNQKYWIYKTIILNNLYGVDLMKEATEIAKLRLFLKLAAVAEYDESKDNLGLEPLPDIDFNIRSGNSLVGFVNMDAFESAVQGLIASRDSLNIIKEIRERAVEVQSANNAFRKSQDVGGVEYREAKIKLDKRLDKFNKTMNQYLAELYGKGKEKKKDIEELLLTYRPFHWLVEFYGIVEEDGGFDVIIGNPPYLRTTKSKYMSLINTDNLKCPDIYGYFLRKSYELTSGARSHVGFIVMHNLAFHKKFQEVRNLIQKQCGKIWFSFYGRIPSGLFSGDVRVRSCIFIGSRLGKSNSHYTTRLHRWKAKNRNLLFSILDYTKFNFCNTVPMFNDQEQITFFENNQSRPVSIYRTEHSGCPLFFKQSAYNWISVSLKSPPCFNKLGEAIQQTKLSKISLADKEVMKILLLLFSGRVFFVHWLIYGDEFDVTINDFLSFPFPFEKLSKQDKNDLIKIYDKITKEFEGVVQFKLNAGKKVGSYNTSKLWHITDKSDIIFLKCLTSQYENVFESVLRHISQTVMTDKN